jgi:hypothetical protein
MEKNNITPLMDMPFGYGLMSNTVFEAKKARTVS